MTKSEIVISSEDTVVFLDNLHFQPNPRMSFVRFLNQVEKKNDNPRRHIFRIIHNRISKEISSLNELVQLTEFYYGTPKKTINEPWIVPSESKNRSTQRLFSQIDKQFKIKVQALIEKEIQGLMIFNQDCFLPHSRQYITCSYNRYVFNSCGLENLNQSCKYQTSLDQLMRYLGLTVCRTNNYADVWDIIDTLSALQWAQTLSLNLGQSPNLRHEITYVQISHKFLRDEIREKFTEIYNQDAQNSSSDDKKRNLLLKYPIISDGADSIATRCKKIINSW